MAKNIGFISLDRKILEWEHFKDHKTFKLFAVLLLLAEYKDTVLPDGTVLKRGQVMTSTRKLAEISGLTHKEVRAHIRALERTQEVAQLPSPKNTIVTVLNYDKYQNKGTQKGTEKGTLKGTLPYIKENKQNKENKKINNNNSYRKKSYEDDAEDFLGGC